MQFLIKSDHEQDYRTGEFLFWSNEEQDWVDKTQATIYAENEKKYCNLPVTGEWVEYN